ncbi:hypothetical protein, partial [Acidaminococcus fermentans]|uniref:hypothetical protein n=2 Tax=Acidaminococcus TaxID=904 RepID=UPI00241FAB18
LGKCALLPKSIATEIYFKIGLTLYSWSTVCADSKSICKIDCHRPLTKRGCEKIHSPFFDSLLTEFRENVHRISGKKLKFIFYGRCH